MVEGSPSEVRGIGDRRTTRLDGLGERVVVVAHELKVPLSLIIGSLESLEYYITSLVDRVAELETNARQADAPPSDRPGASGPHVIDNATALVRICREGADRLEHVVQEITAYARGGAPPRAVARVDIAHVLRTAVDLAARSMAHPPPVRLEVPDLPAVRADEATLARVVVNLLRNAFVALAGSPAPLVRVTAAVTPDSGEACAEIRIADNGPGIPEEQRTQVFEPFFTGKTFGAGLGLGLAIAKELIESQHGTIALDPAASGTVFVIRLPLAP
jgi:signal transduction histidine kinase